MPYDSQAMSVQIAGVLNSQLDFQLATAALSRAYSLGWSSGVGANQADKVFADQRTIAASGNDDLDLNGVLADALGVTINLLRVKALLVVASAANTNNVVMGGGSNPVTTIMGGTTPTLNIRPGGLMFLLAPDAVAYGVTAATADILRFSNSGAGTSVTYDLVIVGASA